MCEKKEESLKCCYYIQSKSRFCKKYARKGKKTCFAHRQKSKFPFEKPDVCPICSNNFPKNENSPLKPCSHWICRKCIIMSGLTICHLCRTELILTRNMRNRINKVKYKMQKEKLEEELRELFRFLQEEDERETQSSTSLEILQIILEMLGQV